ncbi:sugar transferase [Candidatus Parcubacteria bacterium]|jgi:exopolysaccharide biosynthesis polyprenyl glycosylphosphotransferase|nr:MAG: sugar transferase [Candidatus Parcubacteria bacterium]
MKKLEVITAAILVPLDFAMVVLAGLTAYTLRFNSAIADLRPVIAELSFRDFIFITFGIAIIWIGCLALGGLYNLRRPVAIKELGRIILASSAAMTAVILFIFFRRELFSSRFIIIVGWLLAILYLTLARMLVRLIVGLLKKQGVGLQRLVMVGESETADRMVKDLYEGRGEGFRLVARLDDFGENEQQNFLKLINEKKPDAVILASTNLPQPQVLALLDSAQNQHLDFYYIADLFSTHAGHLAVNTLFGEPVVEVKKTKLEGWGRIWKRLFDFVFALLALIITSPLMLVIAVLIKLDSAGPVFAKLRRVGEKGKVFTLLKFRSMIKNAHGMKPALMDKNERRDGPLFKMTNDPRITRMGRFLRRTSLDEIPQFFNALVGQMSVVGPRPHEPEEVEKYQPWHRRLLTIKPGITGMAQVSGRSALSFDEEAKLDIAYIESWSFATDLMIILKTPKVIFSRKAAV